MSPLGTCFPQSIGLSQSFNASLIHAVGVATGFEVRASYNSEKTGSAGSHCWSPMVNINRMPTWGRSQEGYGEDPGLTALFADAYVRGLQFAPDGVHPTTIASCKHYDVHAGPETGPQGQWGPGGRFGFNVQVMERDWREIYLPAWEACAGASAGGVMCSYNSITITDNLNLSNNVPACFNPLTLQHILRDTFNFKGYVVSDCGALRFGVDVHGFAPNDEKGAVAALTAGCDLECDCCRFGPVFPALNAAIADGNATVE